MKYQIMKFFRCYAAIAVAGLLFAACAEEERITYYDPDAPAPVALDPEHVSVKNHLPGKAVITYKAPDDQNLLYVRAEYETAPGMVRSAQASLYCDTLLLEGFSQAGSYAVQLFSVGKNEKRSAPVGVNVKPSTPPVLQAFPTIDVKGILGGVRGSFTNLHESELKLSLLADTIGDGRYILLRSFVTNQLNANFFYLGLPPKESDFACYIQDRWGNRSDTVFFDNLTPLLEDPIDNKEEWTWLKLPSDNLTWVEMGAGSRYNVEHLWDRLNPADWYAYIADGIMPFSVTIRLGGKSVMLSRLVMYSARMFGLGYLPSRFQVYGSNADSPADNIRDDDWTLLGYFELALPSGQPTATPSDEATLKDDGAVFFFEVTDHVPNPYLPTKFVRLLFLGNEGASGRIGIGEIDLFGTFSE